MEGERGTWSLKERGESERCNTRKAFGKLLDIVNAMDIHGYIMPQEHWLRSNEKCQLNRENSFKFMTIASNHVNTVSFRAVLTF